MPNESIAIESVLPPTYRRFLPELFQKPVPRETRATCSECVMCSAGGDYPDELGLKFFSPDIKCCSFHPSLPNFLVGGVLASNEPELAEGKRRLREKIARGTAVTPRGVLAPRKYTLFYEQGAEFFGRSPAMRCPYYDDGNCTVWKYREGVCATYFCKYERGAEGKRFWEEVKRYLGLVELKLSLFAVTELEKNSERIAALWDAWDNRGSLSLEDIEERPPTESARKKIWGEWRGREEEFFVGCHEVVSGLTAERFRAMVGVDEVFLRAKLTSAYEPVASGELPRRLKKNPELRSTRRGENYLCSPTGMGDAFEMSGLIFPLLDAFDGREHSEVCAEIERARKIQFPTELLQRLYYWGVLVDGAK